MTLQSTAISLVSDNYRVYSGMSGVGCPDWQPVIHSFQLQPQQCCVQPGKHLQRFEGNFGETAERRSEEPVSLSECYDAILSRIRTETKTTATTIKKKKKKKKKRQQEVRYEEWDLRPSGGQPLGSSLSRRLPSESKRENSNRRKQQ